MAAGHPPESAGCSTGPSSSSRAERVPAAVAAACAAAVRPEQVSDILFTSGTTGRSKGAMSAHRQALDVARAWAECGALTSADRYLVVNPFFHSFGYKAGILACLLTGATMVPQLVYDPERGHAADRGRADHRAARARRPSTRRSWITPAAPSADLSSLRLAVTGAAVVPVALVERMRAELSFDTVLTAYGLTEAVVATMCRPGDDPETVARTSGRATAGFEIRIVEHQPPIQPPPTQRHQPSAHQPSAHRPQQHRQSQEPHGTTGEILLRGPNVMLGYLDDPDATKAADRHRRLAAHRRRRPPGRAPAT